ncbi:serine/threonine-protein kinase HAL4/sat4, partial [Ascosphaera acerosa]
MSRPRVRPLLGALEALYRFDFADQATHCWTQAGQSVAYIPSDERAAATTVAAAAAAAATVEQGGSINGDGDGVDEDEGGADNTNGKQPRLSESASSSTLAPATPPTCLRPVAANLFTDALKVAATGQLDPVTEEGIWKARAVSGEQRRRRVASRHARGHQRGRDEQDCRAGLVTPFSELRVSELLACAVKNGIGGSTCDSEASEGGCAGSQARDERVASSGRAGGDDKCADKGKQKASLRHGLQKHKEQRKHERKHRRRHGYQSPPTQKQKQKQKQKQQHRYDRGGASRVQGPAPGVNEKTKPRFKVHQDGTHSHHLDAAARERRLSSIWWDMVRAGGKGADDAAQRAAPDDAGLSLVSCWMARLRPTPRPGTPPSFGDGVEAVEPRRSDLAPSRSSPRSLPLPLPPLPLRDARRTVLVEKYGRPQRLLGRGGYGDVWLSQRRDPVDPRTMRVFAIKEFKRRRRHHRPAPRSPAAGGDNTDTDSSSSAAEPRATYERRMARQFCLGSSLRHPNIIHTIELLPNARGGARRAQGPDARGR